MVKNRAWALKSKAKAAGVTVETLVISAIERSASIADAADLIGVRPNTVHYHLNNYLKKHNLVMEYARVLRLVPRPGKEAASE